MMGPAGLLQKVGEIIGGGRVIGVARTRYGNRGYMYLLVWGLVWLVGCVPAEPIQVTRVVAVTVGTTVGVTETAVPTNTPTLTAIPSPVVVATVKATRTATAVPTEPTPSETPTPTPSMTPHLPMVEGQLPPIGHDLLFIADGSLKRWSHERGEVEILLTVEMIGNEVGNPGGIGSFQLGGDGKTIVADQFIGINEPPTTLPLGHHFIAYDLESGAYHVLANNVSYPLDYVIAPDGRYLAYIQGDPAYTTWDFVPPKRGTIYVKEIGGDGPPEPLGYCSDVDAAGEVGFTGCGRITWTPDSQQVIWSDRQGLWLRSLDGAEARLVAANSFDFGSRYAVYSPRDWSPDGRYLRLYAAMYEGFFEAVFDLQTEKVLDIPSTQWSPGGPVTTHVMWLESDRLFSVRGGWGEGEITAEVLRIEPETDSFVVESSQIIPAERLNYVSNLVRMENGSIAFSLNNLDSQPNPQAGLYILDEPGSVPRKVNDWPYDNWYGASTIWSPDGRGAFVLWWVGVGEYDFVYVPADEAVFYNVRQLLGESVLPFSFTWVP